MGGLKKDLPITYWTFLIGSLAIAGVPAAGRLLQQGRDPVRDVRRGAHACCGSIGALTSLLTATYMFRLVFLTFHGERRHDAGRPALTARTVTRTATVTARTARRARRHGAHLARCAAGDGVALDRARARLGRRPATSACRTRSAAQPLEHWLEPASPRADAASRRACGREAARSRSGGGRGTTRAHALELTLMGVSSVVAFARHRHRGVHLAEAPRHCRRRWRALRAASPAAAEQVLRRRGLRRGDRPADPRHVARTGCGAASTSASSTAPSTARRDRRRGRGAAAAAADRLGARLCGVAVPRRRADCRLLPVAMTR